MWNVSDKRQLSFCRYKRHASSISLIVNSLSKQLSWLFRLGRFIFKSIQISIKLLRISLRRNPMTSVHESANGLLFSWLNNLVFNLENFFLLKFLYAVCRKFANSMYSLVLRFSYCLSILYFNSIQILNSKRNLKIKKKNHKLMLPECVCLRVFVFHNLIEQNAILWINHF